MSIKPIRTKEDHKRALAEVERLWDAKAGTREADVLEVWVTLIDAYEREHTPILPPSPIDAIKFRLEQAGKTRKDLEAVIGASRARVSEILSGRRKLSLAMIRALNAAFDIPLHVLLQESEALPATKRARQRPKPVARKRSTAA